MRSFSLETLSEEAFDEFSASHPQGNFQQTSAMGRLRARQGVEVEYLGVREDGALVAAALFETHRSRLSTFAAVHDGPLCDWHDADLTAFLVDALRRHAKAKGAAQLEITPERPYRVRDSFGAALPDAEGGAPDPLTVDTLIGLGFRHGGFTVGYTAVPRWRYLKDLHGIGDEKALLDSYAKNTRRNVKIARNSAVEVERVGRDRLATFHAICELSCEKQGFENRPLSYFEDIYDTFGDSAEFLVASIDMRAYLASWERKRDGFLKDIEKLERSLETTKYPDTVNRKIETARSTYEASLRRVEQARAYLAEDGERVPVAAALFVWHRRECVYLFSGSNEKYAKFYAPTAIQHHVMTQCLERGVERYNFYGISGVFDDPSDPGRGVLEFKQGFEGYVEEMPGEFDLPVRPLVYETKQSVHRVLDLCRIGGGYSAG
ncbi:aminoacyltransferase [Bifidobacterium samirii]|uniref:Peptidoglycan bridge formation protein FemAB n=1 Tax=Bifidobacterium samirii TaxID=2306974 RepID=A0A430FRA6_9BIFI|nr:aminoacyltransferase [Bifidobacterium samirii]RSX55354.1 peptidoglycan bridge formation protein FemAB [Bifidobacterium samirii]